MTRIVVADIGGTHARFAIAQVTRGKVENLEEATTFNTVDYPSFARAWRGYVERLAEPLPKVLAMSFAGPVHGDILKLTNNPWVIRPSTLAEELGLESVTVINDFAAVGHAIAHVAESDLMHVCGPETQLPCEGTVSIIGPGTGLGVAHVLRSRTGYHVIETEGGHINFAPLDSLEDRIARDLRKRFGRVSAERVISGPGLNNLYEILSARNEMTARWYRDDELWTVALEGSDALAVSALERFCLCLGAVAGDIALAQGGVGVVIGGGLGLRLADRLGASGFPYRFTAKGRFEAYMANIPVKALIHPQPGLLGAAAAYAAQDET